MQGYKNYKQIDLPWLKEIPSHWGSDRIKNLLSERKERNKQKQTNQILSLSAKDGVTLYEDKKKAGNKAKDDLTLYNIAYPNDLIINCMNVVAGSVGLSKYYGAISPVYYALHTINSKWCNINYVDKLFKLFNFQRSLLGLGKGILMHETDSGNLNTVRLRISMTSLNSVEIPLPPIDEQNAIVNYLDRKLMLIDKYIANKKAVIEKLNEYKKAIVNQAVTKGLNINVKMKMSKSIFIKEMPSNWSNFSLKRIIKINPLREGKTKYLGDEDKISFLPMERISTNGSIDKTSFAIFKDIKSGFTYFERGDVVLAKITPCFENGKSAYLKDLPTKIGFGTTELIVLRPTKKITAEYLYLIINTPVFLKNGEKFMTGSAGQKRIPKSYVEDFVIHLPEEEEQKEIVEYCKKKIEQIDKKIATNEKQIALIQEYRTRLISDVVTGKVCVL